MPRPELAYPKTPTNKVNRSANRGAYDTTTIHTIVNAAPVVHVSFITPDSDPPLPAILPMIGVMGSFARPSADISDALDLYLHGYVSSRLFRTPDIPVAVSATLVDGLVLALTSFNHSFNYRSAVLHGRAAPVTDPAEKLYAMRLITESVLAGRWEGSRLPPTKAEMDSTGVLRVQIESASAKVRSGGPSEDRADLEDAEVVGRVWTGVVPTWTVMGEPVGMGGVSEVPEYIKEAVKEGNERARREAEEAVKKA